VLAAEAKLLGWAGAARILDLAYVLDLRTAAARVVAVTVAAVALSQPRGERPLSPSTTVRRLLGHLCVFAAALVGVVVAVVWLVMPPHADAIRDGTATAALDGLAPLARTAWTASRWLGAVLVVPVVEELAFRGYL
jgi:membrane protease YdiL (CAAX protease family)